MPTRKRNLLLVTTLLAGGLGLLIIVVQTAYASNGGGSTLAFDGGDLVTVPHTDTLNLTTFTFEAWIKLDNTAGCKTILGKWSADDGGYVLHINGAYMGLFTFSGMNGTQQFGTIALSPNTWYHVAVARDAAEDIYTPFYLNGVRDVNRYSRTPGSGSTPFYIGGGFGALCGEFEGEIDEVRVWNVERTEAEIRANMFKPLTGSEPNLVSYWRLDDGGTSQTVIDSAGGRDGTRGNDAASGADDPTWVSPSTAPIGSFTSHQDEIEAVWAAQATGTNFYTTGLRIADASFLDDVGDDVVFAHNDAAFGIVTDHVPTGVDKRWARVWELIVTDVPTMTAGGNVDLTFDISDAGGSGDFDESGTYFLLKRAAGSTDVFTTVNVISSSVSLDRLTFRVPVGELGSEFTVGGTSSSPMAVTLQYLDTRSRVGGYVAVLSLVGFGIGGVMLAWRKRRARR
jgi:hypothetical protein